MLWGFAEFCGGRDRAAETRIALGDRFYRTPAATTGFYSAVETTEDFRPVIYMMHKDQSVTPPGLCDWIMVNMVQTSLKVKTIITCDGLSKLLVRFAQDADETHHSTCIYERGLVVGVFVDEVPRGTSGVTLHGSVVTGEKLNQSWNAMQSTDLRERDDHTPWRGIAADA